MKYYQHQLLVGIHLSSNSQSNCTIPVDVGGTTGVKGGRGSVLGMAFFPAAGLLSVVITLVTVEAAVANGITAK